MLRSDPQSVATAPRTEPLRLRSSFKFKTHDTCHQTQITPTSNIPTGDPVSSGEWRRSPSASEFVMLRITSIQQARTDCISVYQVREAGAI